MLQIDLFSDSAPEAPTVAQPTQRQKAPEKPLLLSKTERRFVDVFLFELTPAEIEHAQTYAAQKRARVDAWVAENSHDAVRVGARKMAAELIATLAMVLPLCAGPAAEVAPASSVQPKSEPPPGQSKKKRGRPPTIRPAEQPAKKPREDKPPRPNDRTAAAVPPPKVRLAPEAVMARKLINIPRRAAVEA